MNRKGTNHPLKEFYTDIHVSYDRVNHLFTFGRDRKWRKRAAAELLRSAPENILDLCTGTGDLVLEVARLVEKGVHLTGYDFNNAMLEEARKKHGALQQIDSISPVEFVEGDASHMPFEDGQFDAVGITFGIRNLMFENTAADRHLAELYRILRSGGTLVVLESSRPENRLWRFFNTLYLKMILPYLGGVVSGNLQAYKYLARSSENYYTIREMNRILEHTGFRIIRTAPLFLGSAMLVVAEKK